MKWYGRSIACLYPEFGVLPLTIRFRRLSGQAQTQSPHNARLAAGQVDTKKA